MSKPKIHGFPQSSYVWSSRAAAAHKGVDCEFVAMTPGSHKAPEHLARHPFGKVPALEHDGLVLFETSAICRYLEAAFDGPALYPADPAGAGLAEQWISAANSYYYDPAVVKYFFGYVFPGTDDGSPDRARIDAALPKLERFVAALAAGLAGRDYLGGDAVSAADLIVAPIVMVMSRQPEGGELVGRTPAVAAWVGRMAQNAALMSAAPG